MRRAFLAVAFVTSLAMLPATAPAEEHDSMLEEHAVAAAHTPADHSALAEHFRAKAAEARAAAARHRSMGRTYGGGKQGTRAGSFHCKRISAREKSIAAEFEELAKLHAAAAAGDGH